MRKNTEPKAPKQLKFAVLAVDTVVLAIRDNALTALVMTVNRPPYFKNIRGFPGGLIRPDETAERAAQRILREKGGLKYAYLEQLATFSGVRRDPRGRVVSVAYLGLASERDIANSRGLKTESETQWYPVARLKDLAYDHDRILRVALRRLRAKLGYTNIISHLLPREFTLSELQKMYEIILRLTFDKRNFRKRVRELALVAPTGKKKRGGTHRPAALYKFTSKKLTEIEFL